MSQVGIAWAIDEAPCPARLLAALLVIARRTDEYGRGSYQSVPTLAAKTRKSERQVQRDVRDLLALGLIREGDQDRVLHIPADRRPIVYDLCIERVRGDTHDTPRGDIHGADGVTPMSPKQECRACKGTGEWTEDQDDE